MNRLCLKRINRDMVIITEEMPEYAIYSFNETKNNTLTIEIVTPNQNILEFVLPNDYPFKPPISLKINGMNYKYQLKNMPSRIQYLYNHPYKMYPEENIIQTVNMDCLCCTGLLCSGNWSPVVSIKDILLEINRHNDLKRHLMYKILLKKIFDKKNIMLELLRAVYDFL